MLIKKIVIPCLFVVLMLTLFLIFGVDYRSKTRSLEAQRIEADGP